MSICQRLSPRSWRLLYVLFDTQRSARYHDARNHFIKCNKLPVSFPFNKYLRRCVRHVFVELLHIHWGIWVSICMVRHPLHATLWVMYTPLPRNTALHL